MAHKKYKILIAPQTYRDIEAHFYFLARVSVSAAKRLRSTLLRDIRSLAVLPERNPPYVREGVAPEIYRYMLSAGRYRIIYQISDGTVRINGVEDCRQNQNNDEAEQ
jgi:plasmid stabilization system protein ParE